MSLWDMGAYQPPTSAPSKRAQSPMIRTARQIKPLKAEFAGKRRRKRSNNPLTGLMGMAYDLGKGWGQQLRKWRLASRPKRQSVVLGVRG